MIDIVYIRSFRVGPYPIFDTVLSYIGIYMLAPLLSLVFSKFHIYISRSGWMWLTLPLSVLFHFIFRQQTPLMKSLFNPDHYYIELIVIIVMLFMGLRNVGKPLKI